MNETISFHPAALLFEQLFDGLMKRRGISPSDDDDVKEVRVATMQALSDLECELLQYREKRKETLKILQEAMNESDEDNSAFIEGCENNLETIEHLEDTMNKLESESVPTKVASSNTCIIC